MRRSCVHLSGILLLLQLLLLLLLLTRTTDGFQRYTINSCEFNSTNPDDIEYIYSAFYNQLELYRFSSSLGKFVGYTELGVKIAAKFNNDPDIINRKKLEKYRYCQHNIGNWYSNILSKSVKPYAVLNTAPSDGSERVLVCSIYGFFPRDISVTWTNHHQPIHSGVSFTDRLPDSDWTYQLHSHLEYSPRKEDQISCMIEHKSLKEPMVLDYEGGLSDGDRNKVAIGASGLALGLVLSLAGFLYYRHKSRGLILVPNH